MSKSHGDKNDDDTNIRKSPALPSQTSAAAVCVSAPAVTVDGFRSLVSSLQPGTRFPALETLLTLDLSLALADLDLTFRT